MTRLLAKGEGLDSGKCRMLSREGGGEGLCATSSELSAAGLDFITTLQSINSLGNSRV